MPIITLISDLGLKDYYVGAVKGAIYSQLKDATVVDITHEVDHFNISQAAYILKNAFNSFPEGTVHIISVNAQPDPDRPYIAVKAEGHYFIGPDNGIFSLLFEREPEKIVELTIKSDSEVLTFPMRDLFVKAACHLARGGTLEIIGSNRANFNQMLQLNPVSAGNVLKGSIIYIDAYYNVIANITTKLFKEIGKGRPFVIDAGKKFKIDVISKTYNDVSEGEILAIFNASGYLEMGMNKGKLGSMMGLKMHDTVTVTFE